jgi:hypothetical protein
VGLADLRRVEARAVPPAVQRQIKAARHRTTRSRHWTTEA